MLCYVMLCHYTEWSKNGGKCNFTSTYKCYVAALCVDKQFARDLVTPECVMIGLCVGGGGWLKLEKSSR